MHKHSDFDLLLYDDDELASILNSPVVNREKIHEWPLSSVEGIHLADSRRFVYKSQVRPSVEPEFYESASSCLLVPIQFVYRTDNYAHMLIHWVEAKTLKGIKLPIDVVLDIGRMVLTEIHNIDFKGDRAPSHMDVGTADKWFSIIDATISTLTRLMSESRFRHITDDHLNTLHTLSRTGEILELFNGDVGLAHGDLKAENILLTQPPGFDKNSIRVLDWQRPIVGPTVIDLVCLLESLGYSAIPFTGRGAVYMYRLLLVQWYVESADKWLPQIAPILENFVLELLGELSST